MKINVSTKELQEVTKKLLKVALKKSTIPVLESILITAEGGVVTAIASDTCISVAVTFKSAEIEKSGSRVIPKDTITLMHKLKSDYITITDDTITAANRKVSYSGIGADLFPESFKRDYDEVAFHVSKEQFMSIANIRFACSDNEAQPILTGVLLRDKLAVATDRHRLALWHAPEYKLKHDIVIPAKVFEHAEKLSEKAYTGAYSLHYNRHGYAELTFDNVVMEFRLLEGTYPDVKQVVPKSFKSSVKVNKQAFMDELTLMKEIASESKIVKLRANDGKLVLSAESAGKASKVETDLDAQVSGDMDTILFNAQLLLDGLKYNSSDEITLSFTGAFSPAMIDDTYLVLPCRGPKAA